MQRIVVHYVDDLDSNLLSVKLALSQEEHRLKDLSFSLETFSSDTEYYASAADKIPPDLVLLDIAIDRKRDAGYEMARFVRGRFPAATVVMYSQFDDANTILRYLGAGADEFLSKETPLDQMPMLLAECHNRILEKRRLAADSHETVELREVHVTGRTMKCVIEELRRVLQTQLRSVFVLGETGTGKEVVARILHSLLEPKVPFITVNCGALTASLLESQLFGHAKGAYTGANIAREGFFESASEGFVFLDEVADLSLAAQVALLRVIENQEITRLGESTSRKVNVRILSASNQNLHAKVANGTFRQDLLERLSAHQIVLPALRERKEEIEFLANHFLSQIPNKKYTLAKTTLELLMRYDWPANVRELRNVILDMAAFSSGEMILPSSLPKKVISSLQRDQGNEGMRNDAQGHGSQGNSEGAIQISEQISMAKTPDVPSAFANLLGKLHNTDVGIQTLEDELFLTYANFIVEKHALTSLRKLARLLQVSHPTVLRKLTTFAQTKQPIPTNLKQLWENNHDK